MPRSYETPVGEGGDALWEDNANDWPLLGLSLARLGYLSWMSPPAHSMGDQRAWCGAHYRSYVIM